MNDKTRELINYFETGGQTLLWYRRLQVKRPNISIIKPQKIDDKRILNTFGMHRICNPDLQQDLLKRHELDFDFQQDQVVCMLQSKNSPVVIYLEVWTDDERRDILFGTGLQVSGFAELQYRNAGCTVADPYRILKEAFGAEFVTQKEFKDLPATTVVIKPPEECIVEFYL